MEKSTVFPLSREYRLRLAVMEARRSRSPLAAALGLVMLLGAAAEAFAYWPGLMTWDAIRQYGQALDGD